MTLKTTKENEQWIETTERAMLVDDKKPSPHIYLFKLGG